MDRFVEMNRPRKSNTKAACGRRVNRAMRRWVRWAIAAGLACPTVAQAKVDTIVSFSPSGATITSAPVMNENGLVAYVTEPGTGLIQLVPRIAVGDGQSGSVIALRGQSVPVGIGDFGDFSVGGELGEPRFVINDQGSVLFHSRILTFGTSNHGVYLGNGQSITQIARDEQVFDGTNAYTAFEALALNNNGQAGLHAATTGGRAVFRVAPQAFIPTSVIARSGLLVPGEFTNFDKPGDFQNNYRVSINDSNEVAFFSAHTNGNRGLYRGATYGTITTVARSLSSLPNAGQLAATAHPMLNNNSQSAFWARDVNGVDGIYRASTTGPANGVFIAQEGGNATNGRTFTGFSFGPAINASNQVAFRALLNDGNRGIYRGSGNGSVTQIAIIGDAPDVPGADNLTFTDLTASFGGFDPVSINDKNQVAFLAEVDGPGIGDPVKGIYLGVGNGKKAVELVRVGQALDGSTITDLKVHLGQDYGGSVGFNNNGQVAFQATLANGHTGVYRATPTLKISAAVDTTISWLDEGRWNLGFVPDENSDLYDVAVGSDPTQLPGDGLTVQGPMERTTVAQLDIGSEVGFNPQPEPPKVKLLLRNGDDSSQLTVLGDVNVSGNGILSVVGNIQGINLPQPQVVQKVRNNGIVELSDAGIIMAQEVINNGLVTGDGDLCGQLTNLRSGQVLVNNGQMLAITGTNVAHTNEGQIMVEETGQLRFSDGLNNLPNGLVVIARDAMLSVGDFENNGELSGPGMLDVRGALSGQGLFGDGSVNIAGQLTPANGQVGVMSFGGDLAFGADAVLEIGYGGPDAITGNANNRNLIGDHFQGGAMMNGDSPLTNDVVHVMGQAQLDGTLEIDIDPRLLDQVEYGNEFVVMTYDSHDGQFDLVTGGLYSPLRLALAPKYEDQALILLATAPGDANYDLKVDAEDLNKLALNWQQDGKHWDEADFNGDGLVDAEDLNQLALNWQFGVNPANASLVSFDTAWANALANVAIPEPGSLGLLLLTTLTLAGGRGVRPRQV